MAASPVKTRSKHGTAEGLEEGDLPRGFFRSEIIKGRYDPAIEARRIPDLLEEDEA